MILRKQPQSNGKTNMSKPIRPDEVLSKKAESIPDEVFAAFNELITKNWNGQQSQVTQKSVVSLIRRKLDDSKTFDSHWLDIEDIYRNAGWVVKYDKPGFNEDYDSLFVFSKKRTR